MDSDLYDKVQKLIGKQEGDRTPKQKALDKALEETPAQISTVLFALSVASKAYDAGAASVDREAIVREAFELFREKLVIERTDDYEDFAENVTAAIDEVINEHAAKQIERQTPAIIERFGNELLIELETFTGFDSDELATVAMAMQTVKARRSVEGEK